MGLVSASVEVCVDTNTAFKFIADPKNKVVYPESLKFKVGEVPGQISDGTSIRMSATLLGQRFE